MPNQSDLDEVFRALSSPVRRGIVERLGEGPAAMTALAEPFDMAPPSFLQHLRSLESAGLVRSEKRGRERIYALQGERLLAAENWLDRSRRIWEARLDQLEAVALALKAQEENP